MIANKSERIDLIENRFGKLQNLFKLLKPFRVMIGIFCLILSIIIFASLALTSADKVFKKSFKLKIIL